MGTYMYRQSNACFITSYAQRTFLEFSIMHIGHDRKVLLRKKKKGQENYFICLHVTIFLIKFKSI